MSAPARRGTVTLVLGGARSGKSRFAEGLVTPSPLDHVYIATAEAYDDEMRDRISHHRKRRDGRWKTVEAPRRLVGALWDECGARTVVLVDCLTLWLSNLMLANPLVVDVEEEIDGLMAFLVQAPGDVVLVSNEVGSGIVPENALARAFRDHQGRLNQLVAARSDRVTLVAAGLPLDLKLPKEPTP